MDNASAFPTKAFFTGMLTRDIETSDAILDLIDNCIDGIVRLAGNNEVRYQDFSISIEINESNFKITDNCGGIPREIAENYAFRFGRPSDYPDALENKRTVGVYGIGMKRAIFKMGYSGKVSTLNDGDCYSVEIPPGWFEDDNSWELPITNECLIKHDGTSIVVEQLHRGIVSQFADPSFIEDLQDKVSITYAVMLGKGLEISLNNETIRGKPIRLLFSSDRQGIDPYLYTLEDDGVSVKLAVGFYTSPPTQEQQDAESEEARLSENAGWTIICNDRVVVYNDKTRLTGWGEAKVPNFHTQFINIAGVVLFYSSDAQKLPMTTTKRGIDASSEIYLRVKDFMREGLKMFTSFTNQWKTERDKGAQVINGSTALEVDSYFKTIDPTHLGEGWKKTRGSEGGFKKVPELPHPTRKSDDRWIRFIKPYYEIEELSKYLFDDLATPAEVGEAAFDRLLQDIKK